MLIDVMAYLGIGVLIAWILGLRDRPWLFIAVAVLWLPILLIVGFLVITSSLRERRIEKKRKRRK